MIYIGVSILSPSLSKISCWCASLNSPSDNGITKQEVAFLNVPNPLPNKCMSLELTELRSAHSQPNTIRSDTTDADQIES